MGSKIRDTTAPSLPLPVFNSKSKRPSVEFCPKCLKVRRRLALSGDSLLTPPRRPLVAGSGTPPAHRPLVANSLGRRPPPRHAACTGGLRYRATFILTPRRKHASRTPTRTRTQSCTRAPPPGRGAADSGPRSNARVGSHRPLDQAPAASHGGPGLIRPAALDSAHSAVRPRSASCPHPVPFSPCAVGQGNDANAALSTVLTVSPPFSTHPSTPSLVDLTPDPLAHAEAGLETPALGSRAPPHLPGCGLRPVRDRPAYRGLQRLLQRSVRAQHPRRELPRGHSHSQRRWPHTLLPAPCPLIPLASLTAGPPGCARCWPHCVPRHGRCPRQPGSRR